MRCNLKEDGRKISVRHTKITNDVCKNSDECAKQHKILMAVEYSNEYMWI